MAKGAKDMYADIGGRTLDLLCFFPALGGEGLIGNILVWVVIRELGPLFAAMTIIARSGSAIASELGSMKVHEGRGQGEILQRYCLADFRVLTLWRENGPCNLPV